MSSQATRQLASGAALRGGFTLVELIVVLIIIGVLAVAVIPRFSDRARFDAAGYGDQVLSALQYARQQAVAQRRNVCATIGVDSGITLTTSAVFEGVCAGALIDPVTRAGYVLPAPNRVTLVEAGGAALPLVITFGADGQTNPRRDINVLLDGAALRTITVEAVTGYAHSP